MSESKTLKFPSTPLILLLIGSFLLRIGISFLTGLTWYSADTYEYFRMAEAFPSDDAYVFFPMGFPFLILLIKSIVPSAEIVPLILVGINVLLSTVTVYFGYRIVELYTGSSQWALITGIMLACWPHQLNYVRFILSEIPTTFFLMWAAYALAKQQSWIKVGVLLGLAIAIRSNLFFIVFLGGGLLLLTKAWKPAGQFILGVSIPLVCVCTITFIQTSRFIFADNSLINVPLALQSYGGNIPWEMDLGPKPENFGQAFRLYLGAFVQDPLDFLWQRLLSLYQLWGGWPMDNEVWEAAGVRSTLNKFLIGLRFPLLLAAVVAAVRLFKTPLIIGMILVPLSITLVHLLLFSEPRHAVPAEPFLILLVGVWLGEKGSNKELNG